MKLISRKTIILVVIFFASLSFFTAPTALAIDADLDGYFPPNDCNDSSADAYPGNTERCDDNIDNDCDNLISEGCSITDNDGDGKTPAEGDCNDSDSNIFLGATEVCDRVDNDCDTIVDEDNVCASASTTATVPTRPIIYPQLGVEIPGLTFSRALEQDGKLKINFIGDYVIGVYRWMLGAGALIAIIMIVIGGVQYMIGGAVGDVKKGTERIKNAMIGLVLLLGTYVILYSVNQELVLFKPLNLLGAQAVFVSSEGTDQDVEALNLPSPSGGGTNDVPYFSQRDYANSNYGVCGTIKSSGCGPTSMAMVLKFYGQNVDPEIVADSFADQNYRACPQDGNYGTNCSLCQGTSHDAFTESVLLNEAGLKGTKISIGDKEKILEYLRQNIPVIISIGKNTTGGRRFTSSGHYMVLTGISEDGTTILLNDPNSSYKDAVPDDIFGPLKAAWVIERR